MNTCLFLMILLYGSIFQAAQQDIKKFSKSFKQRSAQEDLVREIQMMGDQAVRFIPEYHRTFPGILTSKYKRKSMLQISEEAGNRKVVRAILEILE